jgi:DUF4097 and DUF4098 domain-containing protein YvlB
VRKFEQANSKINKQRPVMENIKEFFLCILAMLLALFSSVAAQDTSDAYRSEVFSTSAEPAVVIETSGGNIHVIGHDDNEVRVDMIVRRGNRVLTPSDTDLSDFDIEIKQDGNTIYATAKRESRGLGRWLGSESNISVSFIVNAPSGSAVEGQTSGGSVTAKNLNNTLSMKTSGGSVTAEEITGRADLRTSGGSISLKDIEGDLSARTSGGSIRADGLNGSSELRTSGGSIHIENSGGAISARTSGGSIRAHMIDFTSDLDFVTSGGSIRVQVPPTENFDLDLRGSRVEMTLRNFTGDTQRNSVSGRIGEGGPKIAARTSGGTVRVDY